MITSSRSPSAAANKQFCPKAKTISWTLSAPAMTYAAGIRTTAMDSHTLNPSTTGVRIPVRQMLGDWFGSDANVVPTDDIVCGAEGVKIHNGFQNAWMLQRADVIARLRQVVQEKRATGKPLKVFVTGHSLGAALAASATYDIWCHGGEAGGELIGEPLFGTITYGQPILFYGQSSIAAYKSTVPNTRRMRISTCAREREGWKYRPPHIETCPGEDSCGCGTSSRRRHATCRNRCAAAHAECKAQARLRAIPENMFASCDPIGAHFPEGTGVTTQFKGYLQPDDFDFQAAWIRKRGQDEESESASQLNVSLMSTLTSGLRANCFGMPNGLLCHLLNAYSEGLRREDKFNGGLCKRMVGNDSLALYPANDHFADDPITIARDLDFGANQEDYPAV